MRRTVGWRDVLPWSTGILGLFVLAHFVIAWAIKWEVVRSGERSVGARVEVGDARVSILGGSISLCNIRVANPQSPLRNLIEADRCDLELEPSALLHKQTIIRDGAITGVRFGTPRDTSGALHSDEISAEFAKDEPLAGWLDQAATKTAHDWLDRLNKKFDRDLIDQLESIRLTDKLLERWPQQSVELQIRARALRRRTTDFQAEVREAQKNPLRHVDFLDQVPDRVDKIRAEVTALSRDVENLPNVAEADRRAIVAAREHDEKLLRDELKFDPIDTNVLSAYLLQERMSGPLGDLLGWVRWVRQIVPAKEKHVATSPRGHDVLFTGCRPAPNLLIRTLHLQGTTRLAGQPIEFFGTLSGVTDRPARHDQPMRLKLHTRGSLPLQIQATIDRTGPVARDQLLVDCGGLVLPKLSLGGSDKLRLSLAPTAASLNISITLDGDKLSGDIQLVQKQVEIKPSVSDELARLHVDEELEKTLGDVRSLATRISLSGTLDEPKCRVWSNLGPAVAEAMDRALARTATGYTREALAQSQERVNRRLAEFDRQLADTQDELNPQLADSATALDQLADANNPGHRLTLEHLGRRLPADSLFR